MVKFPYKKYKIIWEDPTGYSGWQSEKDMESLSPFLVTSEAYIHTRNKRVIKTFASYINEDDGSYTYGDVNTFPASCLVKLTKI
jgi:hypothetical protein